MQGELTQIISNLFPNSEIIRTWYPIGGVSAQVTAVEVKLNDASTKQVLIRQHPTAKKEFILLKKLYELGLPVQKPYTYDESLKLLPAPYIVLEYVEGNTQFAPQNMQDFIKRTVETLIQVHHSDTSHLKFLQQQAMHLDRESFDDLSEQILDTLKNSNLIAQNNSVLLHGDYWIGNLLWRDNALVAVIDWEDAAIGDPLYDLSNTRFEILWAFGEDVMQQFTADYQAKMPHLSYELLPYYDLYATLKTAPHIDEYANWSDYGRDDITPNLIHKRYRWFVSEALKKVDKP